VITIPETIWSLMFEQFKHARKGVERVAYLDGLRLSGGGGVVTTLVIPDATLEPGWYEVTPEAMSQAGAHFRAHGLVRLAQVHTHSGRWVGHSERDSKKAYSQETGAVSIVIPFHGRCKTRPAGCGVNLRSDEGWRLLDKNEAEVIVRLIPGYLDFRR
jgi:hypothetical protein